MKLKGKISLAILIIISFLSVTAHYITKYEPNAINLDCIKTAPGAEHLMGTDNKGRDIFSRILYGGRISIGIALTAAIFSMSIGLIAGVISGYYGGIIDTSIMSFVDFILSFPSLLLAIAISILFPPGIYTVIIAIVAVGWAPFARIIRGYVLTIKESTYIEAAKAIGCSNIRILLKHIIPQCIPLLIVMTGIKMGGYIITEASLSFLGLGAQPPMATWGSMVSAGRIYIASAPWIVFIPGFMIAVTAFCFNILGDELRDKYRIEIK
ncbi:MAG: ABC transporter permease [Nitrospirae bacterium]|jgi:ABC-type dipeptide/oligopeptide/nickel transport system permease subunit|nr:ABC transporter permease [Nitrospirota bacterium]